MKRALADLLYRTFNEGVGWFLASAALLGLSLVFLRDASFRLLRYHQSVSDSMSTTLRIAQEPMRTGTHPGLTALLLSPVNSEEGKKRGKPSDDDQKDMNDLRSAFVELVRGAVAGHDRAVGSIETARTILGDSGSPFKRKAEEILEQVEAGRFEAEVYPSPQKEANLRLHRFDWGPMVGEKGSKVGELDSTALSILMIPSLVEARKPPKDPRGGPEPPPQYSDRLGKAALLSRFLEPVLEVVLHRHDADKARKPTRILAAYFISPDSVVRLWRRRPDGGLAQGYDPDEFNPANMWASANYFQWFLKHSRKDSRRDAQKPADYQTLAYIDHGGAGVVRSDCDKVLDPAGKLLGIVCTDYAIDPGVLTSTLPESQVLTGRLLTLPYDNGKLSLSGVQFLNPDSSPAPDPEQAARIERRIEKKDIADLKRETTFLDVDGTPEFLVPIKAEGDRFLFVLARIKAPLPPTAALTSLGAAALFGSLFLLSGYKGYVRARFTSEVESRIAVLQGLQVGVIALDSNDLLQDANDHAERLFGRELPRHGTWKARWMDPIRFCPDLIGDRVVTIARDGTPEKSVAYKSVREQRTFGESSRYYARLKSGAWILLAGSPILPAPGDPETFGVVEAVSPDVETCLREILNREDHA